MELVEITKLDAEQLALLGLLIAGINELVKRARAKDWWVVATIATSGLIGGFVAMSWNLAFVAGVGAGFALSGFITVVSAFGNKSTPTKSEVLVK